MSTTSRMTGDVALDDYLLVEHERLRDQGRTWEPETARLLDRVRLARGSRCLDIGCGRGESMRLMAEHVGPAGQVTGVDVDASVEAQDPTIPGAPFDLVFARLLLIHVDDPVAVMRRLWDWVAPGGHLVIQEYDLLTPEVLPTFEAVQEFKRVGVDTLRDDVRLGLRLPALHAEAGLGAPDGIDVGVRASPRQELAPVYEGVYRSMLESALLLGLTTQPRSERWPFARDTAGADAHAAPWPLLIGTWKRKPRDGRLLANEKRRSRQAR